MYLIPKFMKLCERNGQVDLIGHGAGRKANRKEKKNTSNLIGGLTKILRLESVFFS